MSDKASVNAEFDEQGRVVTTVAELERVEAAWALAIGRFIVVFASLEYWTYLFIRTFGTDAQRSAANGQRLWQRLQTMELVLQRLRLIEAMQVRVDTAIAHFRGLTPTRNLLAHNAPIVHVYTENADGTGKIGHKARTALSNRSDSRH